MLFASLLVKSAAAGGSRGFPFLPTNLPHVHLAHVLVVFQQVLPAEHP
jgi:hypothetical protein